MTRILGGLALLCAACAVVVGNLPLFLLPPKAPVLYPAVAALVFACAWAAVAGVRQRGVSRFDLTHPDGGKARTPLLNGFLRLCIALPIVLGPSAALGQAIGPDGAHGRHVADVRKAGGGDHELRIDSVVGKPRDTGVTINDHVQYAATVTVTVPFTSGPRVVTVEDVHTLGAPVPGETVHLLYAPDRPDLGVLENPYGFFDTLFPMIFIWGFFAFPALFVPFVLSADFLRRARVFHPVVHLPAFAILAAGGALSLPLALGYPASGVDLALAIPAMVTPWLAAVWAAVALNRV
ncbi:MAG: hypothetical protein HOU01_21160 [Streptomycetaceae bacterium]|nr:hypothetical protein [Streptomycetaceae bacterium]